MPDQSLPELFNRYLSNTASDEDLEALKHALGASDDQEMSTLLKSTWNDTIASGSAIGSPDSDQMLRRILSTGTREEAKVLTIRFRWLKYGVAAAVLLLAGGAFWLFNREEAATKKLAVSTTHKADMLPGGNKAILTLADGSSIILDSAKNGSIALQGGSKIIKQADGQLAYNLNKTTDAGEKPSTQVLLNTISTPKGGNYQIVLPDGSKVWLNAASSLRFPASFSGKERKVELKGEAYFEIAPDKSTPFHLETNHMQIDVLGTDFNVMAYDDEPAVKTTLIEGSVQVNMGKTGIMLKPGEQASASGSKTDKIRKETLDAPALEQVVAWKNNKFRFYNTDLDNIMRQLSRWYDVEVVYENDVRKLQFGGGISKKETLAAALEQLELTGTVKFRIEGKKVFIK